MNYIGRWYAKLVAEYPYVMVCFVLLVVFGMAVPLFKLVQMPTFDDPVQGFRARGTMLRGREIALRHIENELDRGSLHCKPFCKSTNLAASEFSGQSSGGLDTLDPCNDFMDPFRSESLMVFESLSHQTSTDLFNAQAVHDICAVEEELLLQNSNLLIPCSNQSRHFSLGFYIGRMVNQSNCSAIDKPSISRAKSMLLSCKQAYDSGILKRCYEGIFENPYVPEYAREALASDAREACKNASETCLFPSEAYAILNFIVDVNFLRTGQAKFVSLHLRNTAVDFAKQLEELFKTRLDNHDIKTENLRLSGFRFGIEYGLYLEYTKNTLLLFILAIFMILIILVLYLQSLLITFATIFLVGFSFIVAWFSYAIGLHFLYFPAMNCMAGLLLIAIGADDVFVYYDLWLHSRREHPKATTTEHVFETLRHAAASIFVTSFTTSSAFFANTVNRIADIRLFGIFAGLCILVNFVLMMIWIPPAVVIAERLSERFEYPLRLRQWSNRFTALQTRASNYIFKHLLPGLITKFWFLWLIIFTALGLFGILSTFVKPGLKLPAGEYFQFYRADHPFQYYIENLRNKFAFAHDTRLLMPVQFAWGIEADDNGKWHDPNDIGVLEFNNNSIDFFSRSSQQFFLDYCHALKNSTLIDEKIREHSACYFDVIKGIMEYQCIWWVNDDCCEHTEFPFDPDVLRKCMPYFYENSILESKLKNVPILDYPVMRNGSNTDVTAYICSFVSSFELKYPFRLIDKIYKSIRQFFSTKIDQIAPDYLKDGWFSSVFVSYDLQLALNQGTFLAMFVSLGVASGVMFLTSLNVVITSYAIMTIALSNFFTIGVLVYLGWELNILESIAITMAIGLTIDFPIHYGVAYRLVQNPDRLSRMRISFNRVGSAVFMAAVTTFLAGAAMMPSYLESYRKIGTFLMLVMFSSYVFSTLFFMSLCRILGPQGKCGQIILPLVDCQDDTMFSEPPGENIVPDNENLLVEATKEKTTDVHLNGQCNVDNTNVEDLPSKDHLK